VLDGACIISFDPTCSGSGLPLYQGIDEGKLAEIIKFQTKGLNLLVKRFEKQPDSHLLYSTCSINERENEDIVRACGCTIKKIKKHSTEQDACRGHFMCHLTPT